MTKFLAEDFRSLLNKLDEYIVVTEKEPVPSTDDNAVDDTDTDDEPVDDMLTAPAGLEKVAKHINANELIKILKFPKDSPEAANFRSAINALKAEHPKLTSAHALALATAFDHLLSHIKKNKLSSVVSSDHVAENSLDMNKIQGYMKKDTGLNNGSSDDIGQMKAMIDAVDKHGTPNEKKELGLNEQEVDIIKYNSGHGEQLDTIAKDPKRHAKVQMVTMKMSANGKPEIVFTLPGDNEKFTAEWSDKYGWVADFD